MDKDTSLKRLSGSAYCARSDILDPQLALMAGLPLIVSARAVARPLTPVRYSENDVLRKVSLAVKDIGESIYSVDEIDTPENGRREFYVDCLSTKGYVVSMRQNGSKVLRVRKLGKSQDDHYWKHFGGK